MQDSHITLNISTSERNKDIVRDLTKKLGLGTENVIARIAFAYSIAKGERLDINKIQDSRGKSYKEDTILGSYKSFYVALICQFYNIHKSDPSIGKYLKMHVDQGLELIFNIFESNPNFLGLDFLLEQVDKGIDALEGLDVPPDHVQNYYQQVKTDIYKGLIELEVGVEAESKKPVTVRFNDVSVYNNRHIAVAGQSGSGKTQFALELLRQLSLKTNNQVKFLFLDFKGLKKGQENSAGLKPFFEATQAEYIDAPQTPFPLNPLQFIDLINEKNRFMGINKFVDIITKYANLGKVQAQQLKEATRDCFIEAKAGEYPSFGEIYGKVLEIAGDRPSTLTEIMDSLSELDMFRPIEDPNQHFLQQNYYFSLSGDLPYAVRFTATFLIINYIYNTFSNMDDAPVENNLMGMRYVLIIDEAHTVFKNRKSQDILESMLRELRSKGVCIMMLSQGIDEFVQPTFDFSSNCEMGFLLEIKDQNPRKIARFLGLGDNDQHKIARVFEKIRTQMAISSVKESNFTNLIELTQLYLSK